jgi:hypothetical protein
MCNIYKEILKKKYVCIGLLVIMILLVVVGCKYTEIQTFNGYNPIVK